MNISYRFSSPQGDVVADDNVLARPFAIGPGEYHEFMTLRDFFDCVRRFVLKDQAAPPEARVWGPIIQSEEIEEIVIRYEKYGTLYQICSVDVSGGGSSARMCVSAALSRQAKETLEREFSLLARLGKKNMGFLPSVFKKDRVEVHKDARVEDFLMVLLEWFEGYEEWHFQPQEGATRAFLWDMRGQYRFLSEEQTFDLICQASRILTLYYGIQSTERIIPWHHGGGDFIVKTLDDAVDVRLITVRGYEPLHLPDDESQLQALSVFCLETLTKMRLDKREGMGDSTWADPFVIKAAMQGFFDGLKAKEARGEMTSLKVENVLQELRSYGTDQLKLLVKRQLADIEQRDSSDYRVVLRHLDHHVSEISAAIRSFSA